MGPSELLMRLMHRHLSPTITPPARVRCREGAMPSRTNKRLLRVNRWVKRGSLGVPGSACGGTEGVRGVFARSSCPIPRSEISTKHSGPQGTL